MTQDTQCDSVNNTEMELFVSLTNEPVLNPVEARCQNERARWVIFSPQKASKYNF